MIFKVIVIILGLSNGEMVKIPFSLMSEYSCFDYLQKVAVVESEDDLPLYQQKKVWIYYCKNSMTGQFFP